MPPAKKPATSASRARAASREPAALKRLNTSLGLTTELVEGLWVGRRKWWCG